jgi:hypothetical protein
MRPPVFANKFHLQIKSNMCHIFSSSKSYNIILFIACQLIIENIPEKSRKILSPQFPAGRGFYDVFYDFSSIPCSATKAASSFSGIGRA